MGKSTLVINKYNENYMFLGYVSATYTSVNVFTKY